MTREEWISYFETATDESVEVAALLRGPSPEEVKAAVDAYRGYGSEGTHFRNGVLWAARAWQPAATALLRNTRATDVFGRALQEGTSGG